jgi:hypothetical protein
MAASASFAAQFALSLVRVGRWPRRMDCRLPCAGGGTTPGHSSLPWSRYDSLRDQPSLHDAVVLVAGTHSQVDPAVLADHLGQDHHIGDHVALGDVDLDAEAVEQLADLHRPALVE